MTQWDDAARKAAEEIRDEDCRYDGYVPDEIMQASIAKHFAGAFVLLRSTYDKLVELAILVDGGDDVMEANMGRINAILNDLLVIEAMKGKR